MTVSLTEEAVIVTHDDGREERLPTLSVRDQCCFVKVKPLFAHQVLVAAIAAPKSKTAAFLKG